MTIDRKNPIPLYIQLKQLIISKIEAQEWKSGEAIPTEHEFEKNYNVSRTTIRQALSELVAHGILEKVRGKGTYVSKPKYEPIRPELTGFTQDMELMGFKVKSIILEKKYEFASDKIQQKLRVSKYTRVFRLDRVRLVDDTSIGIHESYINHELLSNIEFKDYDFTTESLYHVLAREGVHLEGADETVEAKLSDKYESELLGIDLNSIVLVLTRVTYLEGRKPVEFAKMVYRADKYKYSLQLK